MTGKAAKLTRINTGIFRHFGIIIFYHTMVIEKCLNTFRQKILKILPSQNKRLRFHL